MFLLDPSGEHKKHPRMEIELQNDLVRSLTRTYMGHVYSPAELLLLMVFQSSSGTDPSSHNKSYMKIPFVYRDLLECIKENGARLNLLSFNGCSCFIYCITQTGPKLSELLHFLYN